MISYDDIYDHLTDLLRSVVSDEQVINPNSLLVEELGLDSLRTMELLMALEDRLDATIPMNLLPDAHSVDDLVKALQKVVL